MRSLSASSGQTSIEGKGTVTSLQRLDGTFDFTSRLLDVDDVLALLTALVPQVSSSTHAASTRAGDARGFGFGHIVAKAKVDKARALGYQIDGLTTSIDLQGATLTANPLRFELYGGRYDSTLVLDLSADRTVLDHKATLTGANVATLAQLLGHPGAATGSLNLDDARPRNGKGPGCSRPDGPGRSRRQAAQRYLAGPRRGATDIRGARDSGAAECRKAVRLVDREADAVRRRDDRRQCRDARAGFRSAAGMRGWRRTTRSEVRRRSRCRTRSRRKRRAGTRTSS